MNLPATALEEQSNIESNVLGVPITFVEPSLSDMTIELSVEYGSIFSTCVSYLRYLVGIQLASLTLVKRAGLPGRIQLNVNKETQNNGFTYLLENVDSRFLIQVEPRPQSLLSIWLNVAPPVAGSGLTFGWPDLGI